ncbi:hypothetical protein KEM54_005953 [Ascosphaera aggregata]|nr:hypothetical protein KEM54_005953 [Ascosphaera aggregata]
MKGYIGASAWKWIDLTLRHVQVADALPYLAEASLQRDSRGMSWSDPVFWINMAIAACLVVGAAAFSGLTLALMDQDDLHLRVIQDSGSEKEQARATKVIKLMRRGKHWVLVTLLLGNVIVNETLPIILDRSLGGGWVAVLVSTGLVVVFGEILPQAICVNYGLTIGAFMSPFVFGVMLLFSPIGYPVAWLLSRALGPGESNSLYTHPELKTLLRLHEFSPEKDIDLDPDEVEIMSSVLDLRDNSVGHIITSIEDVFTLSADTVLNEDTVHHIWETRHSRVPVHDPCSAFEFVGVFNANALMTYNPQEGKKVRELGLSCLPEMASTASCLEVLRFFRQREDDDMCMVLISRKPGHRDGVLGIVTLGDVINWIIKKRKAVDALEFSPSRYARHSMVAPTSDDRPDKNRKKKSRRPSVIFRGSASSESISPTSIKRSPSLPITGRSKALAAAKQGNQQYIGGASLQPLLPKTMEEECSPGAIMRSYGLCDPLDEQSDNMVGYKGQD